MNQHRGDELLSNSEVEEMAAATADSSPTMLVSDTDWHAFLEMTYVDPAEHNYEGI